MKKNSLVAIVLLLTFSVRASVIISGGPSANNFMLPLFHSGKMISLSSFMKLKPSTYKELTGKKMSVKERVSLFIFKHYFKNSINSDGTINLKKFSEDESSLNESHFIWFVLGFLIIGFFISLFINDENRLDRIKWTIIGFGSLLFLSAIIILA